MAADLAKLSALAAKEAPMALGSEPIVPGRVLLADGDGLAYFCAGKDGTSTQDAKLRLCNKVASARRACGAETVHILLTGRASHKGHRYAVATVKPYQGQRKNSRRPDNWEPLRHYLESGAPGIPFCQVTSTDVAEADDLFAHLTNGNVIYTQDKDMRMVPGLHLGWQDHRVVDTRHDPWCHVQKDVTYGRKWFWLQMLQGDTADNIPGLPKYKNEKGNYALCGEKTAESLLAWTENEAECAEFVSSLYASYYEEWEAALLEQAILLWMRRQPDSLFDCMQVEYGPLRYFRGSAKMQSAARAIREKVRTIEAMNAAQAETK